MAINDNSSSKFTKFDRNRFRKIYPINRQLPSMSFRSQQAVNIESVTAAFKGDHHATVSLNNVYDSIPVVMVAPKVPETDNDSERLAHEDQVNVNIFIKSITRSDAGKVEINLEASSDFSGEAVVTVVSLT